MKTTTQSFTGYAKIITDFSQCKGGEHYLMYSKQFGVINEIVIENEFPFEYPNLIYYRYAKRTQNSTMAMWLHELKSENYLLFKIQ